MPRIHPRFVESSLYLYPHRDDAERGTGGGGSGFVVGVPGEEDAIHLYAVTAAHVIEFGAVVVRSGGRGPTATVIEPQRWTIHPDGHDVAVAYLGSKPTVGEDDADWIAVASLVGSTDLSGVSPRKWPWANGSIAHGEETFSVSRFLGFDGVERNQPVVRFGSLASPELLRVRQESRPSGARDQESFLVEARSLSGQSGAPVFVYREGTYWGGGSPPVDDALLLGVAWGHLRHPDDETREYEVDVGRPERPTPGRYNAGVMAVVPAWHLTDLLAGDELVANRRDLDR